MEQTAIVQTLVGQHRQLQKDLKEVASLTSQNDHEAEKIHLLLEKFTQDLTQHLHLENDVFYVELLKKMKEKGQNTEKTELFIMSMKDIEKEVLTFLNTYNEGNKIAHSFDEFRHDLPIIIETLILRIETEEAGVYSYWGLF